MSYLCQTNFSSLSKALDHIAKHQEEHNLSFIKASGTFTTLSTRITDDVLSSTIRFFNGVPGVRLGGSTLLCQHRGGQSKTRRERCIENGIEPKRKEKKMKRGNCSAKITIARLLLFSGYYCPYRTSTDKNKMVRSIRETIRRGNKIKCEEKFIVSLPELTAHSSHPVGKDYTGHLPMDERIKQKIEQVVNHLFITKPKDVIPHIEDFVINTLFKDRPPPAKSNQRFFPTAKNVKNHIDRVLRKSLGLARIYKQSEHPATLESPTGTDLHIPEYSEPESASVDQPTLMYSSSVHQPTPHMYGSPVPSPVASDVDISSIPSPGAPAVSSLTKPQQPKKRKQSSIKILAKPPKHSKKVTELLQHLPVEDHVYHAAMSFGRRVKNLPNHHLQNIVLDAMDQAISLAETNMKPRMVSDGPIGHQ